MVGRIFHIGIYCAFFYSINLISLPSSFLEKVSLINTMETRNCYISYVTIKGDIYLVKQKKEAKKLLSVVKDALAAWIAEPLNIAQHVYIIANNVNFPGKVKPNLPASLHTAVKGKTVREQRESKFNALRLRQLWARANNFDEKGLTRLILNHMSWHKDLALIVALDLITGNSDRHCGNLFYDPQTDSFWAIDMDDTFNKDLCAFACEKLINMMRDPNLSFSKKEIKALIRMRDTLQFLVRRYQPAAIIKKLYYFAKQAGLIKNDQIIDKHVQKKLRHYETVIKETYVSGYKLIELLNRMIIKYS